jgi:hypothetical protein
MKKKTKNKKKKKIICFVFSYTACAKVYFNVGEVEKGKSEKKSKNLEDKVEDGEEMKDGKEGNKGGEEGVDIDKLVDEEILISPFARVLRSEYIKMKYEAKQEGRELMEKAIESLFMILFFNFVCYIELFLQDHPKRSDIWNIYMSVEEKELVRVEKNRRECEEKLKELKRRQEEWLKKKKGKKGKMESGKVELRGVINDLEMCEYVNIYV